MNEPTPTRRLTYQPALDGLRAVAVLGVVAYHAGIDALRGGFLGVSTFFTLSGFLITSLLIRERMANGHVDLGSFWSRRLRRLMPAAVVTIVATLVLAAAIGDDSQLARLRADGLASLFHFSNWRFIAADDSYGALFESPSFFRHFWSLAVEEQYYLVVPPLLAAVLALTGRLSPRTGSRVLAATLLALTGLTLTWPLVLERSGASSDRLYFGTDTRVGEIMVGALLAWWFVQRDQRLVESRRAVTVATVGALAAAGVMGVMWNHAHPSDTSLYTGGLAGHAALTLVLIVAAVAPRGPLRAVLSVEPLRRLGELSYAVYLTHWPIVLWLQSETDLGPFGRFGVGLLVSVAVSLLLQRVVELPFRRSTWGTPWRWAGVAAIASLVTGATVLGITAWRTPAEAPIDFAAAQATVDDLLADGPGPTTTSPTTDDPAPDAPVTLAAFGDSTALMTGLGILQWAEDHPSELTVVRGNAKLGCGLIPGGEREVEGRIVEVPDTCDEWLADWLDALGDHHVDIAVVQLGAWEVTNHRTADRSAFRSILDPTYRAEQEAQLDRMLDALHERADTVVLLANPEVGEGRLRTIPVGTTYPEYDAVRVQAWRDLLTETAAADPATVVVDLAGFIDGHPDDLRLRPDGVHFSQETAREVADWLVPEIVRRVGGPTDPATAPTTSTPPPPTTPSLPPVPRRILLTGDSLMVDSAPAIEAVLATADVGLVSEFVGYPARNRTAEQRADWLGQVDAFGPELVVEYMGYWDFAATGLRTVPDDPEPFATTFRRDVLAPWFDDLEARGAAVVVLGAAPTGNAEFDPVVDFVLSVVEAEASERDAVTVLPTADVLAPDGHTEALTDPRSGELERVRRVDGLHLCPDGAERVADLLVAHLEETYDVHFDADPAATGWRVGDWREASPIDLGIECPPIGT